MSNPFRKRKHTTLGAGLVLGGVVAGVAAYLFYSKNGESVRDMLAEKVDRLRLKFFSKHQPTEDSNNNKQADCMAQHTKAPKTDREKLLKGAILEGEKAE